jgi:hypothetical protein
MYWISWKGQYWYHAICKIEGKTWKQLFPTSTWSLVIHIVYYSFCLPEICKVTVNTEKIIAHGQVYVMYKYLNVSTSAVSEDLIIHYWIDLCTRWFKYDWDKLWLVYTQIVPVIFEPPCIYNCIITETLLRVVISSHVCKWILFWPSPAPYPVLCSMAVFLVHVMKAYGGNRGTAPFSLNLRARERWMASFTP